MEHPVVVRRSRTARVRRAAEVALTVGLILTLLYVAAFAEWPEAYPHDAHTFVYFREVDVYRKPSAFGGSYARMAAAAYAHFCGLPGGVWLLTLFTPLAWVAGWAVAVAVACSTALASIAISCALQPWCHGNRFHYLLLAVQCSDLIVLWGITLVCLGAAIHARRTLAR